MEDRPHLCAEAITPGGFDTAASRAILLSDAKRIGWTAFLTPTCT